MSTAAVAPISAKPIATAAGVGVAQIHGDDRPLFLNVHDTSIAPTGRDYTGTWEEFRKAILGATEAHFSTSDPLVVGPSTTLNGVAYAWPGALVTNGFLKVDGSGNLTWTTTISGALASLTDVALGSLSTGQWLFYNGATSKWNNSTATLPTVATLGSILYASAPNVWAQLGAGTAAQFLNMNPGGTAPQWHTLVAADITNPAALTQVSDTNVTLTLGGTPASALLAAASITAGWSGTLAAGRLNANVVQAITNDTNLNGSITAQNLTLAWAGTLAAARLNANVVQSFVNDTNVTATISAQAATLGWSGTLGVARGGTSLASYVTGDMLYATASTTLAKVGIGAANTVLTSTGSAPQWSTSLTLGAALSVGTTLGVTGAATFSSTVAINGITYTFPASQGASKFLQTDGAGNLSWVAEGATISLGGLSDVTLTSNTNGQVLTYNSGTSKWNNNFTTLITGLGTVAIGTWNASVIVTTYGGTGLASFTTGDVMYYNSGTAQNKLAIGAANTVMTSSGTAPQWSTSLTLAGGATFATGVTVSSGGVTVTGNSTITGTLGGVTTLTATTLGGTLSTASQPNVTTMAGLTAAAALATVGTITSGVWNGTAITTANGGTGLTSYTTGDLPYFNSGTTFNKLGIGAANTVLTSTGSAPQWSTSLTLAGSLTAGTGVTVTTGGLTVSSGTTAVQALTVALTAIVTGTSQLIGNLTVGVSASGGAYSISGTAMVGSDQGAGAITLNANAGTGAGAVGTFLFQTGHILGSGTTAHTLEANLKLGDRAATVGSLGNAYTVQGALQSGSNAAQPNLTIIAPLSTGNATAATIIFQTGHVQASGAAQHVATTLLTLGDGILTNAGTLTQTGAATFTASASIGTTLGVTGASTFTGLATFNGGATVASGQTLTLTGATVAGTPTWSSNQAITLSTAAQPNVTSVGTLTALTVSGAVAFTATAGGTLIVGSDPGGAQLLRVGGTLHASGAVTFDSTLAITGALSGVTTLATSSTINGQTISSAANFTGSALIATTLAVGSSAPSSAVLTLGRSGDNDLTVGATWIRLNNSSDTMTFYQGSILNLTLTHSGATPTATFAGTVSMGALTATTGAFSGSVTVTENISTGQFVAAALSGENGAQYVFNPSGASANQRNYAWVAYDAAPGDISLKVSTTKGGNPIAGTALLNFAFGGAANFQGNAVSMGALTATYSGAVSQFERTGLNGAGVVQVFVLATDAKTINDGILLPFNALNSSSATVNYAALRLRQTGVTASSEQGALDIQAMIAGTLTTVGTFDTSGLTLNGNLGFVSGKLAIASASGKITTYAAVATAGLGIPAIYGYGRAAAVSNAASGTLATYTVGASDGTFIVSANVLVTVVSVASFTVTCAYTDEGNTARVLTLTFSQITGTFLTAITNATGTGAYEGVPLHIRAKSGTTITIQTAAGGTYTGVTYNAEAAITQIA